MRKFNRLIWEDDFNEPLDRSFWRPELGHSIRNKELQTYTDSDENSYTEDGCLVIKAITTGNPDEPYTSASLTTRKSMTFLHGRLEIRAKLPYGTGIWPAFWTLGDTPVGWPECGEIDILEMIGGRGSNHDYNGDKEIWSTIHCPDRSDFKASVGPHRLPGEPNLCDDFHIYGVEWDENEMTFYIDDMITSKFGISQYPSFHQPHYALLNIAIGGAWPGNPDKNTVFPQYYKIDWIRYYNK